MTNITNDARIAWAHEKLARHTAVYQYRVSNAQVQIDRTKDDPSLKPLTQEWRSELFHANEMLQVLADLARSFADDPFA